MVGEDQDKNAATLGYANDYKNSYGFPEDMMVVSDPSWTTIREGVSHATSTSMPFFAVLDSQMTLLYAGSDEATVTELMFNIE